jgi:imidazoleglycerol phosphate dehydratase HisB
MNNRISKIVRNTKETRISLDLNLDGQGKYDIQTGIGFLDHMLEIFAKHSLCDLKLSVSGDLRVDDHHVVEDIAIVLGQAIEEAVGNKKGINRYGFFTLPMDEVLISCAIDLGGRMSFETNYQPAREKVNDFATEMVKHFFKSLAENAKMNLHFKFLNPGENEHHRIEALFKSFARALRMSVEYDSRARNLLPTTKGKL